MIPACSYSVRILTCCRISRNCLILLVGISREVIVSTDVLSGIEAEFELFDTSVVNDGTDTFVIPAFLSRNRCLLGGNESISAIEFDCLTFIVELLVLLPSPAPALEHELTSSFGFVAVLESFSAKKRIVMCFGYCRYSYRWYCLEFDHLNYSMYEFHR